MASIRKKTGKPRKDGSRATSWVVDWYEPNGSRRERAFPTRRAADQFRAERTLDAAGGSSLVLADAIEHFLTHYAALMHAGERRRSSYEQKRQHLRDRLAVSPLGQRRMGDLAAPDLQGFFDGLIAGGVSYPLARKIQASVRQFWKYAAVRGWTVRDGAAKSAGIAAPRSRRLAQPVEIPPVEACRAILAAADARAEADRGRARALVRVIMLAGLRAGELRALRWSDLELSVAGTAGQPAGSIRVRRSADKFGKIHDLPKTDASMRTVPLSPDTAAALKAWKLACPPGREGLAFPNAKGGLWRQDGLWRNCWTPVLRSAGYAVQSGREARRAHPKGDYAAAIWTPLWPPKTARHVAASIWIAAGATPRWIMEKMGHSSIKLSQELYGHLWPSTEIDARMAAAADRAFDSTAPSA